MSVFVTISCCFYCCSSFAQCEINIVYILYIYILYIYTSIYIIGIPPAVLLFCGVLAISDFIFFMFPNESGNYHFKLSKEVCGIHTPNRELIFKTYKWTSKQF